MIPVDDVERTILLQDLRRKLAYEGWDKLQLRNLPLLRGEVECAYERLTKKKETTAK